jgi:2-hydroxychromene-2-carboxylate isomerase
VSLRTHLMRSVTAALTSPTRRRAARDLAAASARLRGERPTIRYFHQADDPYSHLAAQMLPRLRARYAAEIETWLVSPPEDSAAPDRERLRAYGLRDAQRLARARGLGFPVNAALPDPETTQRLQAVLADALERGRFEEVASAAGSALWSGDTRTVAGMAAWASGQDPRLVDDILANGDARRAQMGHYLGGMFHFEGEWFWGVDRLGVLERRLADRGLDREAGAERVVGIDRRGRTLGALVGAGPAADRQGRQGVDQGAVDQVLGVGRQRRKPVVMAGMRCMLKTFWSRHMLE